MLTETSDQYRKKKVINNNQSSTFIDKIFIRLDVLFYRSKCQQASNLRLIIIFLSSRLFVFGTESRKKGQRSPLQILVRQRIFWSYLQRVHTLYCHRARNFQGAATPYVLCRFFVIVSGKNLVLRVGSERLFILKEKPSTNYKN